jgi:hypothetical protein
LPSYQSKYFPPIYAKVSQVVCTNQAGTPARIWFEFVTCPMHATFPPDQSTLHRSLFSDTFNLRYNFSLTDQVSRALKWTDSVFCVFETLWFQ